MTEAESDDTATADDFHGALEMAACDLIAGARAICMMTGPRATPAHLSDGTRDAVRFVAARLLTRCENLLSAMDAVRPMPQRLALLAGEG